MPGRHCETAHAGCMFKTASRHAEACRELTASCSSRLRGTDCCLPPSLSNGLAGSASERVDTGRCAGCTCQHPMYCHPSTIGGRPTGQHPAGQPSPSRTILHDSIEPDSICLLRITIGQPRSVQRLQALQAGSGNCLELLHKRSK